jgi:hypothetical protein
MYGKTPCIGVCQIDKQTKLCVGCYRTLQEIGVWRRMPDEERDKVMADLPRRKEEFEQDNEPNS